MGPAADASRNKSTGVACGQSRLTSKSRESRRFAGFFRDWSSLTGQEACQNSETYTEPDIARRRNLDGLGLCHARLAVGSAATLA